MNAVVAIIQARMGATRLPGKTMMSIVGKPMLWHIIQRVREAKLIDRIVVATTTAEIDKQILQLADELGVESYAGSQNDVLDRFYQVAKLFGANVIVRVTADDPFKDPLTIDEAVRFFLENKDHVDYVSNTIEPTFPEGLDIEVFSFDALEKAWKEAKKASEREHVTSYMWTHLDKFRPANIRHKGENLSHLRWTVDDEKDLEFTREVYSRLYREDRIFHMKDILTLLNTHPHLKKINAGHVRFDGYIKSLKNDNTENQ